MMEGEISTADLYGLMQIGVEDFTEPVRAVDAEDGPLVAGDGGLPIEASRSVNISYRLSAEERLTVKFDG